MDFRGVQPVVLVGGRSVRFSRDKLREPIVGGWLVDRPIGALREVFGARVAVVGECGAAIAARADIMIPDRYPGVGPIGGVLSALEHAGTEVFVLAGDLLFIDAATVRAVLAAALSAPGADAVMAETCRREPCIALYRPGAAVILRRLIECGRGTLHDALPAERVALARIDARAAVNINTPDDLPQA